MSLPAALEVYPFCPFTLSPPLTSMLLQTGPNLDQLYITTASALAVGGDLSADLDFAAVQAQYPNSGNLFTVDLAGEFRDGDWRHEFSG